MKKLFKIIVIILILLAIIGFVLYQIYLTPNFVDKPSLTSASLTQTITVDGKERTFLWYAPKENQNINTILYVLHGSRSKGEEVRQSYAYEFDKIADKENIVVVYPTGFENHWNDCRASADYSSNVANIDDFHFFLAMESQLEKELDSKIEYRFATGHSNGGHMCFKLALEHPEWIDGIAPISANLPVDDNLDCKKQGQFVPICLINGTADGVNPYQGGLVEILGNSSRGTVLSTDETMAYWTSLGNCSSPEIRELADKDKSDNSTVKQTTWNCDGMIQAINYEIVNGGHVIPHPTNALPKLLGVTNKDLNAPQAIWSFFKQLRTTKNEKVSDEKII